VDALGGINRLIHVVTDEPRDAVFENFGNRSAANRNHRRTTGERLDHDQTKGLGPIDRKQQRLRSAEKRTLLSFRDLSAVVDEWMIE